VVCFKFMPAFSDRLIGNGLTARTQTHGPKIISKIAFHSFVTSLSVE